MLANPRRHHGNPRDAVRPCLRRRTVTAPASVASAPADGVGGPDSEERLPQLYSRQPRKPTARCPLLPAALRWWRPALQPLPRLKSVYKPSPARGADLLLGLAGTASSNVILKARS